MAKLVRNKFDRAIGKETILSLLYRDDDCGIPKIKLKGEFIMKKKWIGILLILAMTLMIFGCGEKESTTQTKENVSSNKETTATETKTNEAATTEETETKETSTEINKGLTGTELLANLKYKMPQSYVLHSTYQVGDQKSEIVTYYQSERQRMETKTADGIEAVMIYDSKEGVTYQYTVGEGYGVMMRDDEDDEDEGEDQGTFLSGEEGTAQELFGLEGIVDSRIETLNGKDVLYIESTEESDGQAVVMKFWYSLEYPILLKHEMTIAGKVSMASEVSKFEVNVPIDNSLFQKPEGIQFQDFSMDAWDDMLDMEGMEDLDLEDLESVE